MVGTRRRRTRNGGNTAIPTIGHMYYSGLSTFTSDPSGSIVDFPTVAQLALPTDRAYKIERMRVTVTTGYQSSPFRCRAQLGDPSANSGMVGSLNKVCVPMAANVFNLRAPPSSDFIVTKDTSTRVGEVTVFPTAIAEEIYINYEMWAQVGPPLTD